MSAAPENSELSAFAPVDAGSDCPKTPTDFQSDGVFSCAELIYGQPVIDFGLLRWLNFAEEYLRRRWLGAGLSGSHTAPPVDSEPAIPRNRGFAKMTDWSNEPADAPAAYPGSEQA